MRSGRETKAFQLFKKACEELGVEFVGYDYAKPKMVMELSKVPALGKDDLLYRSTAHKEARIAERLMIGPDCAHFYSKWEDANSFRGTSWYVHKKLGLPVIPTFPGVPKNAQEQERVLKDLGGFPIILKAVGGSLGVGVMRIDSQKSLNSITDYFVEREIDVLLRKYIKHDYYVRAVVVGDKVVASHAAYVMEGEFRTNAGDDTDQKRKAVTLSPETQRDVVRAVHSLGIETGGVDLLFDEEDRPYISEVNFPNNFTVTQGVTGIDIAKRMIEHLIKKATDKK